MPIIPLKCPNCSASLTLDSDADYYVCEHCDTRFVVKDAIVKNYIYNVTNIYTENVNVYNRNDFDIRAGKLFHYQGEKDVAVIPETVKIVGNTAFYNLPVKEIKIPNSVFEIEDGNSYENGSFGYCSNLRKIVIPGTVKRIGDFAFYRCSNLEEVVIRPGVEVIGKKAFYDCDSLKKLVIPDTVKIIETSAFASCKSLEKIEIPGSLEILGDSAFGYCKNLETVVSANDLYEQNGRAFKKTKWWTEKLQAERRNLGLCPYCGGEFKGIVIEICTKCGRKKDYNTLTEKVSAYADQFLEELEKWE